MSNIPQFFTARWQPMITHKSKFGHSLIHHKYEGYNENSMEQFDKYYLPKSIKEILKTEKTDDGVYLPIDANLYKQKNQLINLKTPIMNPQQNLNDSMKNKFFNDEKITQNNQVNQTKLNKIKLNNELLTTTRLIPPEFTSYNSNVISVLPDKNERPRGWHRRRGEINLDFYDNDNNIYSEQHIAPPNYRSRNQSIIPDETERFLEINKPDTRRQTKERNRKKSKSKK